MALNTMKDLLAEQLRDLLFAEKKLVTALPKMAKASSSPQLRSAFLEHGKQTERHVSRLEQCFEHLDLTPRGKHCPAIVGLLEEGTEMMAEEGDENVIDAGLIASARRVEHYEIAAYSVVCAIADRVGPKKVADLLAQTLEEERGADDKLSGLAEIEMQMAPVARA